MSASTSSAEVVRELFRRLGSEDWAGAAELFSIEWAQRFIEDLRARAGPVRHPSREEFAQRCPEWSEEEIDEQVARLNRGSNEAFVGGLFGVRTMEDLPGLEPRDAVARHLHGIDLRWRWHRHIDETKERHPQHADAIEAERDRPGSGWTDEVLGSVEHGDVAWVLHVGRVDDLRDYSLRGGGVRTVTLVWENGEWRVADDLHPGYLTALGPLRIRAADGTHLFLE